MADIPDTTAAAAAAALSGSDPLPEGMPIVRGYDFEDGFVDYDKLLKTYSTSGFQASHFGQAVDIINSMVCTNDFVQRKSGLQSPVFSLSRGGHVAKCSFN